MSNRVEELLEELVSRFPPVEERVRTFNDYLQDAHGNHQTARVRWLADQAKIPQRQLIPMDTPVPKRNFHNEAAKQAVEEAKGRWPEFLRQASGRAQQARVKSLAWQSARAREIYSELRQQEADNDKQTTDTDS